MKAAKLFRQLTPAAAVLLASGPSARACSICMANGNPITGEAINGAIFLMLGFLGAMFLGIGAVTYSIYRRRHLPLPPQSPYAETSLS